MDAFNAALSARPSDPKAQSAARARFRRLLVGDRSIGGLAVRAGIVIETAYLNSGTGVAWPSLATLADDIGCKRRAAISAIDELVRAGLLLKRAGGGSTANTYTLAWHRLVHDDAPVSNDAPVSDGAPVSNDAPEGCTVVHGGGVETCTGVVSKRAPEPLERTVRSEPLERIGREHDPVLLAVDAYNSMAERAGLPRCQKVSPGRRSSIRARLKDAGGLDGWQVALEKVEASDFLTGGGSSGWRASIDYIASASGFLKIMEGQHDNRVGKTSGGTAGKVSTTEAVAQVFDAIRRQGGAS